MDYNSRMICAAIVKGIPVNRFRLLNKEGFTLVELLMVIAIIGVLSLMVVPQYANLKNLAKRAQCKSDLRTCEKNIYAYNLDKGTFPATGGLNATVSNILNDAWGRPFEYYNIKDGGGIPYALTVSGLDQINYDFDLYSKGVDGISGAALGDASCEDDIIRANDGQYVGEAKDF